MEISAAKLGQTVLRPVPSSPKHLLRRLLRECSYLPDPLSRMRCAQHTVFRFREHAQNPIYHRKDKTSIARQVRAINDGRKQASLLCRANMGESKALKRVLDFTYGRIGKPRYSLLQEFFEPDTPNSHTELQSLQDHPESLAKQRGWPVVSTKLEALAKSHVRHGNMVDSSRGTLKRSTPEIPSKNAWGRPFPRKREDNLRLKYHGTLKQRLLPPLPEAEWKLLKGLATGKMPWTGPVACRTPAIEMNKMAESGSEIASLADVLIAEPHKKQLGSGHIRSITPRVMRRLWSLVLMQCSVMRQDPNGRSTFEWGMAHGEAARRVRVVSLKDRRLMNVNSAGRHSC